MLRIIRLFVIVLVAFTTAFCLNRCYPEIAHNNNLRLCVKYFAAAVALIVAYFMFPVQNRATPS